MSQLIDVTAPEADEDDSGGLLGSWLKKRGQFVKENEPLLEIVTDKVTVEVAAPASGVLVEILKQTDDEIGPGDVLGRIDRSQTEADASGQARARHSAPAPAGASQPAHAGAQASQQLSPAVRRLIKQHNIDVRHLQGSGRGGRITAEDVEQYVAQGLTPRPQLTPPPPAAAVPPPAGSPTRPSPPPSSDRPAPSSHPPSSSPPRPRASSPTPRPPAPLARGTDGLMSRREPHTATRRQLAAHMVQSALQTAPHVTTVFEADLSRVLAHREAHKHEFSERGAKLTLTAYFAAASVAALRAVPEVNSRWHDDALELFADCNIGIGTAVNDLLVVPVIQRAQDLNLLGIAQALTDVTARARGGKLQQADVQHGTFTITNHGVSGSLIATPIIHQPQSAILGVGKLQKRLVVIEENGEDRIVVRPMVYVTLTLDHRALNGYTANLFLQHVVDGLESWESVPQ